MTKQESVEVCRGRRKYLACSLKSLGTFQRFPTASAVFYPFLFFAWCTASSLSHKNIQIDHGMYASLHNDDTSANATWLCTAQPLRPYAFSDNPLQRLQCKRRLERQLLAALLRFSVPSCCECSWSVPEL
jgi:hypothetical protein